MELSFSGLEQTDVFAFIDFKACNAAERVDEDDANSFAIMHYQHLRISRQRLKSMKGFSLFFFLSIFRGFPWFSMFSFIMPSLIPNGTSLMVNGQRSMVNGQVRYGRALG